MATVWSVENWGSHPIEDNDDCWSGEDFDTLEEARECFVDHVGCRDTRFITLSEVTTDDATGGVARYSSSAATKAQAPRASTPSGTARSRRGRHAAQRRRVQQHGPTTRTASTATASCAVANRNRGDPEARTSRVGRRGPDGPCVHVVCRRSCRIVLEHEAPPRACGGSPGQSRANNDADAQSAQAERGRAQRARNLKRFKETARTPSCGRAVVAAADTFRHPRRQRNAIGCRKNSVLHNRLRYVRGAQLEQTRSEIARLRTVEIAMENAARSKRGLGPMEP
jgi:hypothetical protein